MNTTKEYRSLPVWATALLLSAFVAGCNSSNSSSPAPTTNPAALTVVSSNPNDTATAVPTNQKITATFSESINAATINGASFTVQGENETAIVGEINLDAASNTAIFAPSSFMANSTEYTATITTAVESTSGKTMANNHAWTFTTSSEADTTAPEVSGTDPANSTTDFYLNRHITASFDKSMDPSTINTTNFTITYDGGVNTVSGVVSYNDNGHVATFNPDVNLTADVVYTATLSTAVEDLAGNTLATAFSWSFSGTEESPALLPVNISTAADFAVLAKTGISKTGTAGTMITGDIGVSPAALTFITGFSVTLEGTYATSPFVTGNVYAANMTDPTPAKMTAAIGDMELAYADAKARTLPDFTELGAGNITGMTLEPGLYKWGTNVLVNAAGVSISGTADDVWIFQIAGDLIIDNAAIVTLAGGALPENIFWQVEGGTGVSIGTTAQFKGIVLAAKGITVNTSASIDGRLLAQTAVTLDGNAVTQP